MKTNWREVLGWRELSDLPEFIISPEEFVQSLFYLYDYNVIETYVPNTLYKNHYIVYIENPTNNLFNVSFDVYPANRIESPMSLANKHAKRIQEYLNREWLKYLNDPYNYFDQVDEIE